MMKIEEFTVKVSAQELKLIVGCMHEAPYKLVAPLLDKLQSQVTEQEAAASAIEVASPSEG